MADSGNTCKQPLRTENTVEKPVNEHNSAKEPLSKEENIEQNPESSKKKGSSRYNKRGAVCLAGFLFWANLSGILLLLVGFVAPGWLTMTTEQRLYTTTSDDQRYMYDVYQDYALWYITQCYEYDGRNMECETMTYRTIDSAYARERNEFEILKVGSIELDGEDRFRFHGAGLVFGFAKIVRAETLYTLGLLISLFSLYHWCKFRSDIAKGNNVNPSKRKWALLLLLTVVSGLFLLVPVFMFVGVRSEMVDNYAAKLEFSLGLFFAGLGSAMIAVIPFVIFMQLVFCRNTGDFICVCLDDTQDDVEAAEAAEDGED